MTDTEPTIYPHDITDLSQVRWYVQGEAPDLWIVGDATTKGQRAKAFVLHVARADCHGDGGDSSAWLAEQVAVKLSETDETIRWQRGRAVDAVNTTGHAITKALDLLNNVKGEYAYDERAVDEAVALLRPHARETQ